MLRIVINTNNAAFNVDGETQWEKMYYRNEEVKRILKNVCNQLDNGRVRGNCIDINGNKVGAWEFD